MRRSHSVGQSSGFCSVRVRCAGDTWAVHRSAVSLHSTRCMHFRISKTTHCTLHVRCSDSAVRSLVLVAVAVGLWLRLSGHWSLVAGSALLLATLLPHSLLHATAPMQCECWHSVRTAPRGPRPTGPKKRLRPMHQHQRNQQKTVGMGDAHHCVGWNRRLRALLLVCFESRRSRAFFLFFFSSLGSC